MKRFSNELRGESIEKKRKCSSIENYRIHEDQSLLSLLNRRAFDKEALRTLDMNSYKIAMGREFVKHVSS